jgi:hypothetical protein
VATSEVGAEGVVEGVVETVEEALLFPLALTAFNTTE